jgi:SAM-dependent MidA family methyltransferase
LSQILRQRIANGGPLDFSAFMAAALYHPGLGYYARGCGQVGRRGDFFTSVSVGPLFGRLLAERLLAWWRAAGEPAAWRVVECGAHDGTLAHDVLTALRELAPAAFAAAEFAIPEPLPLLRGAQRRHLAGFGERVRVLDGADSLAARPLPGVVFGNEVIDALPCQVAEWRDGGWHLCRVGCAADGGFCWQTAEALEDRFPPGEHGLPGGPLPQGYRTEFRPKSQLRDFLRPLFAALSRGLVLWFDYGFARPEYYLPERGAGTLRACAAHRTLPDPLAAPGTADLTAHVDFTALAEAALGLGARPLAFRDQGGWLTALARPWLLAMEGRPNPKALRQFHTLTHPGHLGARFHVLELACGEAAASPTPAADLHRLALTSSKLASLATGVSVSQ